MVFVERRLTVGFSCVLQFRIAAPIEKLEEWKVAAMTAGVFLKVGTEKRGERDAILFLVNKITLVLQLAVFEFC